MGLTRAWKTLRVVLAIVLASETTHAGRGSSPALATTLSVADVLRERRGGGCHNEEDRLGKHCGVKVLKSKEGLKNRLL